MGTNLAQEMNRGNERMEQWNRIETKSPWNVSNLKVHGNKNTLKGKKGKRTRVKSQYGIFRCKCVLNLQNTFKWSVDSSEIIFQMVFT